MLEERERREKEEEEEEMVEGGEDTDDTSNERIRQRVNEMQRMIDEMLVAQESMARTIQYLSLALYVDRQPAELTSIREIIVDNMSED